MQQTLFEVEKICTKKSWFSDALEKLQFSEVSGWPDLFGDALTEWNNKTDKHRIRVLSLFSGAGGLDIGFHDAGFQIVECNEIEKDFAATLSANSVMGKRLEGSKVVCMDINNYDPLLDKIDFIIGGPPCQTFSAAGARAAGVNGTDDERGNLFKQYVRILKKLKPEGFLFENVYRIVGAQNGEPWNEIQQAFRDAGYKLYWRILDTADFGVPQFRERLIIVGLKSGEYKFPCPTHGPDSIDNRPFYTASHAVESVVSTMSGSIIGGRHGHLLCDIPPGLNYSFYTERMGHPKPIFSWRSKFSDYLYKADPKSPIRTLKAQGGQYTGPFHWENRTFTVEELKRLQTFPDNYVVLGNKQKVIHQLGNSVPPQLARILGLSILHQVFGVSLPFELELLRDSYSLGFRTRKSKLTDIYAKKAAEAISKIAILETQPLKSSSQNTYGVLVNCLRLSMLEKTSSWDYHFKHHWDKNKLLVQVWDKNNHNKVKYVYTVSPRSVCSHKCDIEKIIMEVFSDELTSVTAVWKYLEIIIREQLHKDDLVQFFGYYQYSENYSISIDFKCNELMKMPFWQVLGNISRGELVREIVRAEKIAAEYSVEKDILIVELRRLKSLGFEIRNHNTNNQINEGFFLIPYSFPSLNERSLQRLTELIYE
jgi:DNA (cytosine-5)-methyltransferase 1